MRNHTTLISKNVFNAMSGKKKRLYNHLLSYCLFMPIPHNHNHLINHLIGHAGIHPDPEGVIHYQICFVQRSRYTVACTGLPHLIKTGMLYQIARK